MREECDKCHSSHYCCELCGDPIPGNEKPAVLYPPLWGTDSNVDAFAHRVCWVQIVNVVRVMLRRPLWDGK